MVFPIAGGTQDTSYEIENSLRFNDDDSARLSREFTQDPTGNRKTFTISCWVKRSNLSSNQAVVSASTTNNFNDKIIGFRSSDAVEVNNIASGSDAIQIITNRLFRDVSAWYHIVVAIDTTQSAIADGVKFYVNGVRDTDFDGTPVYNQNATFEIGRSGSTTAIGMLQVNTTQFLDAYLSEFFFIDGQQLDPTYFGETNDNGVWIPKDYTGTYGNNGFRLEFKQTGTSQNSSGIGADTSGNDEHFAVTNLAAIDVTTDTPTNNFNTLNPLVPHHSIFNAETQGNTGLSSSGVQLQGGYMGSTIMPTSGKWYFEVNILSISGSSDRTGIAIPRFESVTGTTHIEGGDYAGFTVSTGATGRVFVTEGSSTTETDNSEYVFNGASVAIFAVDMDASTPRVYVGKNGTWFTTSAGSGGNPATNTGYFEANLSTGGSGFSVGARHSAGSSAAQSYLYNFGQPAYTISSGNSDANGYGNFEYAVPSGYYAICTKNLAEYG